MKKVLGGVLVGLGAFLLAAGLVAYIWAPDLILKTPEAVDNTTYLTGDATKLNLSTGEAGRAADQGHQRHRSPTPSAPRTPSTPGSTTSASSSTRATRPTASTRRTTGWCRPRPTSSPPTGSPVSSVDDPATYLSGLDYTATTGLVNKFPFDTQKQTYQYWDPTLGDAVPVTYEGPPTSTASRSTSSTCSSTGRRSRSPTAWKAPTTSTRPCGSSRRPGAIIDQSQHDVRTLEDGTNALDMQIQFTDDIVTEGVDDAKENLSGIKLVTETVPLVGFIGGPLLIIVGVLLIAPRPPQARAGRRRPGAEDPGDRLTSPAGSAQPPAGPRRAPKIAVPGREPSPDRATSRPRPGRAPRATPARAGR